MANSDQLPLYEVFIQLQLGAPHQHAGSVHAADAEMALQNARDVYARRENPKSIWVVPSEQITATAPEDSQSYLESNYDKAYRHPQFYKAPKGMRNTTE